MGDDTRPKYRSVTDFGEENKSAGKEPLNKFGVNSSRRLAREGKIDPVVGREQEIERVVQIPRAARKTTRS